MQSQWAKQYDYALGYDSGHAEHGKVLLDSSLKRMEEGNNDDPRGRTLHGDCRCRQQGSCESDCDDIIAWTTKDAKKYAYINRQNSVSACCIWQQDLPVQGHQALTNVHSW